MRRLPFYYGWVIVAVTFVTMAIGVNARTAFSLLFPPILDEFHWGRGVTAGAFSFGFIASAVASPTIGRVMDRFGPQVVMETGVVLMGAGLLLSTYATEPWHLYLTIGVLVGSGSVCLGYSGQSLFLPNWFVRRRGLAMGLAFSGVGIGSMIVLPWLQTVIEKAGWRSGAWTLGVVLLVVLAPINLLLHRRPEDIGLLPDGMRTRAAGLAPRHDNIVDQEWAAIDWTLGNAVRTGRFWWLALGYFCALYAWYAVQVHQTRYLLEVGFNPAMAAWALGLVSLAGIPGQIVLGHVSDRIGREWVWALACFGFALCYATLLALKPFPLVELLLAMVIVQGLLGYGLTSVMGAIVLEIFQGPHFGSIFGSVMVAGLAGGAAGPWLTGLLDDLTGRYTEGFALGVVVAAVSALAIWRAGPRQIRAVAGRMAKEGH